jgi:hypothetical protein
MTFITATTMPLLIALAAIGLSDGVMLPANAAALVGAGVLSVLIFPAVAAMLHKRGRPARPGTADAITSDPDPTGTGPAGTSTAGTSTGPPDPGDGRGHGIAAFR